MSDSPLATRLSACQSPEEVSDILYALGEEGDASSVEPLALWLEEASGELRQTGQTALERIRSRLSPAEKAVAAEVLDSVRKRARSKPRTGPFAVQDFANMATERRPAGDLSGQKPGARAGRTTGTSPLFDDKLDHTGVAVGETSRLECANPSATLPAARGGGRPVKPYAVSISHVLKEACGRGASDVHIWSGLAPCYRVEGRLQESSFPATEAAMVRWLVYRMLDEYRRGVFDGGEELDLAIERPGLGRFRVNVFHDLAGPGIVIRILPQTIRNLQELAAPSALERFCKANRGLILVTGPTGSGKSTTVAAMLDYINQNRDAHILTIEDPVEFVHTPKKARFTQREVGSSTRSFGNALRAALRQDPDVIMVGEMRDPETMELAMTAAETGHLVLSTLHTQTAPKTIDRILGAFPADRSEQIKNMLAETLLAVVCQVLVPKARGGGRLAVHEVMFRTSAIANLIREGKIFQVPNAMLAGQNQGMRLMDDQLAALVKSGDIGFDDALTYAADPEALRHRSL